MKLRPRIVTDIDAIDPAAWERLDHADNPFLSLAFLAGLERSGSIGPETGWRPHHLVIEDGDGIAAFAPTYLKTNSHGEFVFDWAWADAYRRHGQPWYPKLLTAVPYSPVTGPRLLVRTGHANPDALRQQLLEFALHQCAELGLSSWHCNFVLSPEEETFRNASLLERHDWQFHWHNRDYADFDEFLAQLKSRKRKNIRRERRQVAEAGIEFQWKSGPELDPEELTFIHECYRSTFHAYGNFPVLRAGFFEALAAELGNRFQVSLARQGGKPVAMSLFLAGGGRLYGRYWGCLREIPGLHFETAYYQGIDFCIRHGLRVFESGAQGEHKIARGFTPTRTRSFHYIGHEAFREAIAEFLQRETAWLQEYRGQLEKQVPFRQEAP